LAFEVRSERVDAVAVITIDNPPVNALHPDVAAALRACVAAAGADTSVRAIILTGAGRHFVAGGDIEFFKTLDAASAAPYVLAIQEMQLSLDLLAAPVIAAINGTCLGGGCELAMACDIRVADERAQLGQPEVSLGIIPGAGGTHNLARLVGEGAAKRLLFTGERISAAQALAIGLVDEIAPPGETLARALEIAARIASNAPLAVAAAKRAVNGARGLGLTEAYRIEASLFAPLTGTEDFAEGVRAFFEKRKPQFRGE